MQNDPTIKGIQVGQKEIKITQYADDTTVLVCDLDAVSQLLELLHNFKNISGLEANEHKTEEMWLGEIVVKSLSVSNGPITQFMP